MVYEKVDLDTVKKLREKRLFEEKPNWREEEKQRLKDSAMQTVSSLQNIDREAHFRIPRHKNPSQIADGMCGRCGINPLRGGTGKIEYFCQTCWDDQDKVGKNR